MTSLYVLCPTIGCGELIPKQLRCRGTVVPEHKDLYFQSRQCVNFRSGTPEIVVKSEPTMLSYLSKPAVTSILVLSGFGTWPAGVYAQDMVRAFGHISSGRASDSDVESRFESAFPGIKATDRDHAATHPRGPGDLWTNAQKAMSGYTTFNGRRKV
ncbi:hypothetical protein B0H13DRAFT_2128124 [Mycena leptocephala]|nr:hypothetical protein B0H13DRAFT_2128124 [Mycena leptocephala]